jgi:hypothetical protein
VKPRIAKYKNMRVKLQNIIGFSNDFLNNIPPKTTDCKKN